MLIRWFQLRLTRWLQRQWDSTRRVDYPDILEVFEDMDLHRDWEPRLPYEFDRQLKGVKKGGGRQRERDEADAGGGGGTDGDRDPPANRHVRNVQHKHDKFQRYIQMGLRVKEVLERAERPPPPCPFDASVQMCVTYHVLGHCNGLCKRRADHRAHTEEQDQPL